MKPAFTAELLKDTFTEFFNADSKRMEQICQFYKNGYRYQEFYTKDIGQTWYIVSAEKSKDTMNQLDYKIGQLIDYGERRIITIIDITIELPENSDGNVHCVNPVLHDDSLSTTDMCELLSHFINEAVES
jgi:hypothetical protein